MTLCPADYAGLNAALGDLRAWDARHALEAKAGGRRNTMVARVAADLERVANADDATELPAVLAHYPFAEDLDFYESAAISAGVTAMKGAREARLVAAALLTRLRGATSSIDRTTIAGAE